MKISNKNTALGLLEHMDPFSFRICENTEVPLEMKRALGLTLVQEWPKVLPAFKRKVQYISDPFYEAYASSTHALSSVIDAEEINEAGTFVVRSSPSETNTIFYHIKSEGKGDDFKISGYVFFFTKETSRDLPALAIMVSRNSKGDIKEYLSDTAKKNNITWLSVLSDIFAMILFMRYCEVETKEIKAESKGYHVNCKYVNETKQKIEVLDSTWFTTIIRSGAFKVGGHFRMQPYGKNLSQRKLIWIAPFEKEGYTRKAKILNNEHNNSNLL